MSARNLLVPFSMRPVLPTDGDRILQAPGTSNPAFDSVDGESMALGLDLEGVCASSGAARATGATKRYHVLLAAGLRAGSCFGEAIR